MHKTLAEGLALVRGIRDGLTAVRDSHRVDVLICPPFPLLLPVRDAVAGTPIALGAQNAHFEPQGAYTGEVSAAMLADAGCSHVIIGHSERRQLFGETGAMLARKVRAAVRHGLHTIYCVGETLEQREAARTEAVVQAQMDEGLAETVDPDRLTIAYEPVWAIGTGRTATPEQAQDVHALIRRWLATRFNPQAAARIRILYGGSVKPSNAAGLMRQPDIDGALVGGASLVGEEFVAIISAAVESVPG
jgi:triosephosphate isomerase